ncbi:SRPBCC family protein [Gordonia sp. FQ]|uniref:SRPBCC family protein n=1 Tax=Gordonia sp. FQ TaxID=3446634 RepID=UPI003F86CC04
MTTETASMSGDVPRVVSAERIVRAGPATIFGLIADPRRQPEWDGNDNLRVAESAERVRAAGDVFLMELTNGQVRENHVVEFAEDRLIAWRPSEVGRTPPGHLWRWELEPATGGTLVRHTYDWTALRDEKREARARATTGDRLRASIDRLAALAEAESPVR